jgi:hypothetical protein
MIGGRFAAANIASLAITLVFAVPAFSQTNGTARHSDTSIPLDLERTRTGIVRVLHADMPRHSAAEIPPNLIVAPVFRPTVASMLRASPTFRRQCQRLANAPRMTVMLDWFQPGSAERVRARTVMDVTPGGAQSAVISIRAIDDPVELIAHELEHVVEQLDHVDLPVLATMPTSGVRVSGGDKEAFETVRAVRAGLAAAAEVRRHGT